MLDNSLTLWWILLLGRHYMSSLLLAHFKAARNFASEWRDIQETRLTEYFHLFMYAHVITINNSSRSSSWKIHFPCFTPFAFPANRLTKACYKPDCGVETRKLFTHRKLLKFQKRVKKYIKRGQPATQNLEWLFRLVTIIGARKSARLRSFWFGSSPSTSDGMPPRGSNLSSSAEWLILVRSWAMKTITSCASVRAVYRTFFHIKERKRWKKGRRDPKINIPFNLD